MIDLAGREQCWITWISENSSFIFWPVARLFSRRRLAMCVVGRIKKGTSCVILHSIARIVEAMRKPGNWRPVVDCWPHNHPHYRHSLAQHRLTPPHRPFSHTPAVHNQSKHTKANLCCSEPFILTAATGSPGFVYSKWAGCVPHCLEVKELGRQHWNKHFLVRTSIAFEQVHAWWLLQKRLTTTSVNSPPCNIPKQGLTGSRYPTHPELFFNYPTRPDPKIENDWVPGN